MRRRWLAWTCMVLFGSGVPVWGADAGSDLGKRVYVDRCSPCHGEHGHGDGPTAPALQPPPRDFTAAAFWPGRTDEALGATVRGGKPGTMMPPFQGVLTDAEIAAVVTYVRGFAPPESGK